MKMQTNKVKILIESLSKYLSSAKVKVWIVKTGTCTKLDGSFAAKLKLHTSCYFYAWPCVYKHFVHDGSIGIR